MKATITGYIVLAWAITYTAFAQNIPSKPVPPRLVNDFAGFLSPDEQSKLEYKLVSFDRKTSTQIVIVTVSSFDGYPAAEFATRIGHEWGVGSQRFDNGFVLLIKPKTSAEQGEVFIATGYGVEGLVPDAIAKRIVEAEILPRFRSGQYYEGIDEAVNTLMSLTQGEFTAEEYYKSTSSPGGALGIGLVFFLIFLFIILSVVGRSRVYSPGHKLPFWALMALLGSMKGSQRGSWGDFSSGKGGFGGFGGGGFGGFGGGGFGGGGAGGRW